MYKTAVRDVVVYSRKDCHLCHELKKTLARLALGGSFTWREVDIDADDALRRQFNHEVPVVFIDGQKAFKYRIDEQQFLCRIAPESGGDNDEHNLHGDTKQDAHPGDV